MKTMYNIQKIAKTFTVRLPEKHYQGLIQEAERRGGMSLSALVGQAIISAYGQKETDNEHICYEVDKEDPKMIYWPVSENRRQYIC